MAVRSIGIPASGPRRLGPPPYAKILLSDNAAMTKSELQTLVNADSNVAGLKAAYANEVPLSADVAHGATLNSYQSLQQKAIK